MMTLLLFLCLTAQGRDVETKKLLDALAPPLKDPSYSQIEWDFGNTKGIGCFDRQKAWRVDTKNGESEMVFLFDGKGVLNYMKKSNRFVRFPSEPAMMLVQQGGGLAEIHYSGNADRLLKDNKGTKVQKEKLDDIDCTHVTIVRKDGGADTELHFWIDAEKACRRFMSRKTIQGKQYDSIFTYKVVDPPTITDATWSFKVPEDAKDLRGR